MTTLTHPKPYGVGKWPQLSAPIDPLDSVLISPRSRSWSRWSGASKSRQSRRAMWSRGISRSTEDMSMATITTEAERAAIDAVKAAIKALPRSITVEIDSYDGLMNFWKRTRSEFGLGIKTAEEAATPLKCARAFRL